MESMSLCSIQQTVNQHTLTIRVFFSVVVAYDAFPFTTYLMKSCNQKDLLDSRIAFNYRLSCTRGTSQRMLLKYYETDSVFSEGEYI